MKIFKQLLILHFLFVTGLQAQHFSAVYDVQRTMVFKISETQSKSVKLDYTGYFYKSNNRYISFIKPLYLDDYPDGTVEFSENSFAGIYSDTLQGLSYADLDSNITRSRSEIAGKGMTGSNKLRTIIPGNIHWKIMPETRNINGLNCQRALLDYKGNTNICEVWFCSDINIPVSLSNLMDLPGLLVEADYFSAQETYKLQSYKVEEFLPSTIFWPNEFNQPFTESAAKTKRK